MERNQQRRTRMGSADADLYLLVTPARTKLQQKKKKKPTLLTTPRCSGGWAEASQPVWVPRTRWSRHGPPPRFILSIRCHFSGSASAPAATELLFHKIPPCISSSPEQHRGREGRAGVMRICSVSSQVSSSPALQVHPGSHPSSP